MMHNLNVQYITDTAGKKMVILDAKTFDAIIENLEELEDIRLYDEAKNGEQEFLDAETAFAEIEQDRDV